MNSSWLRQIASFIKLSTKKYKCYSLPYSRELPKINANEIIKIVIFGFMFTAFLFDVFLSTCRTATFICFSTNLSISTRAISRNWVPTRFYLLTIAPVLLTDVNDFIVIFLHMPNIQWVHIIPYVHLSVIPREIFSMGLLRSNILYCLNIACLIKSYYSQYYFHNSIIFHYSQIYTPMWVTFLRIILSNDIEKNPGGFKNGFFNFCTWNLNSLGKDKFNRVRLLEAHNSIFNYDLISLCETSLNESVELPEPLLENYTFISCNNSNNTKHGGVGLFYKTSLPLKVRNDLSFEESIVVESIFGRKKIFFTVIYRSLSHTCGSTC